jgi:hypothetical protein
MTGVLGAVAFKREAPLVPPGGYTAAGFGVECFHDILDVFFDGAHAAMEHFRNLAVAFARRDPAEDLRLPRGQRGERRKGDRFDIAAGQASGNLGGAGGHGGWRLLTAKRAQRNGCKHVVHPFSLCASDSCSRGLALPLALSRGKMPLGAPT